MKKCILILGAVLSFNANAEIVSGDKCGDDCTWTFDTETGKLTVSGTGDMYDWGGFDTQHKLWEGSRSTYQTYAPWGEYSSSIQKIEVTNGINYIGGNAFYNTTVSEVHIADSVTNIGGGAFQFARNLNQIDLPQNLEKIGHATFTNTSIETFIIPEGVSFYVHPKAGSRALATESLQKIIFDSDDTFIKDMLLDSTGIVSSGATIYCKSTNTGCNDLKEDADIGANIISYAKEDGVYALENIYYASMDDMVAAIEGENGHSCGTDINVCKAEVLENKGLCNGNVCSALVAAANNGQMLKIGSKTYGSLDALLKGDYDKRRIYTIEEANFVAGPVNRVSIKYR